MITAKDLQPQNVRQDSNPGNDNKIRKAWVLQTSEDLQARIKLKYKSQEARFALYAAIDDAVSDKWIELMRKHVSDSVANGAKIVGYALGAERLEDAYCMNADDHLVEAGALVVAELITDIAA